MNRIPEIIIVEGRDDTAAILRSVDAVTIETHGYGIRPSTWDVIDKAYETTGIIIFTDPDTAGEQIRRRLAERYPNAKHAFLDRGLAEKEGDIGIENASSESIRNALAKAHQPVQGPGDAATGHPVQAAEAQQGPGPKAGTADVVQPAGTDATHRASAGAAQDAPADSFTRDDLFHWGLDGVSGAARRRQDVGNRLGIGMASSKTFLRRLNHFGISREEIETALRGSQ